MYRCRRSYRASIHGMYLPLLGCTVSAALGGARCVLDQSRCDIGSSAKQWSRERCDRGSSRMIPPLWTLGHQCFRFSMSCLASRMLCATLVFAAMPTDSLIDCSSVNGHLMQVWAATRIEPSFVAWLVACTSQEHVRCLLAGSGGIRRWPEWERGGGKIATRASETDHGLLHSPAMSKSDRHILFIVARMCQLEFRVLVGASW